VLAGAGRAAWWRERHAAAAQVVAPAPHAGGRAAADDAEDTLEPAAGDDADVIDAA
jgi:hypothetical protein